MFEGGLAELHTHLGGSVASDIMWSLAHEQGIALPVKDFWEFDRLVTVSDPRGVDGLDALNEIYHWTELIQSSPLAVEQSVHGAIGGPYLSQRITTLELRFNPMKRNRGGERDLDHIILAAIRGLDRASIEYPQVRCGLILMMDRTFSPEQNAIIVDKAIRWASRGVVGIDIAGPRPGGARYPYGELAPLVEEARRARRDDPRRRGGRRARARGGRRGRRDPAARPDRPRHPGRAGSRADGVDPRAGNSARDLPDVQSADRRPGRRRGRSLRLPDVRRARRPVHGRHGRPRDDADAPPRRARAPAEDRRGRRGGVAGGERARARSLVRRLARARLNGATSQGVAARIRLPADFPPAEAGVAWPPCMRSYIGGDPI